MYFLDTGLCARLMGWGSTAVLENSVMSGAFFETWVVSEIWKSYLNNGSRPPLYFYRDSNKKEIDLIICQDGVVHSGATKNFSVLKPIEKESKYNESGTSHLKNMIGTGTVVCLASDLLPIDRKNWYVPAWII